MIFTQLRLALTLMTRLDPAWFNWRESKLPLKPDAPPDAPVLACWAFPLIGLLVATIASLVWVVALALDLPPIIAATLAVLAAIIVTGGLHEDGLADCADGLFGPMQRSQAQRLAIMRDPHLGTFAVIALFISLTLRIAALASQPMIFGIIMLFTAHILSRTVMTRLILLPLARTDGMAAQFMGQNDPNTALELQKWQSIFIAYGFSTILLGFLFYDDYLSGLQIAALVIALHLIGSFLKNLAEKRLGGVSGDVMGAGQQIYEITALVILAIPAEFWARWS